MCNVCERNNWHDGQRRPGGSLFIELGKDVGPSEEVIFVVIQFDEGGAVFGKENFIADGNFHRDHLAINRRSGTDGYDFSFVHLR